MQTIPDTQQWNQRDFTILNIQNCCDYLSSISPLWFQEQTGDASLIAAVVKAIMKELSNEMNHINHFKNLKTEFTDTNEGIHPWLHTKPNTEELAQIKKTIRGLKSKLRHKEADRQDLVEVHIF